ncbi:MAG: NUDIX domain-containing protein [Theionarchaea archaeon]|nr:NUDIX domain-containing protein [Theionarchaea archaeon]MBU7000774.1 NUDIX domain-containing protein [Theionarchaea archaeon]MBU7021443.1 NUDIX domain-containing protein [Theionarchaea archaeon]MBU7033616.1 NUDIX domain-containing protein [Theionarchaea archaeon]MBU7040738.1 NUDIX domain-containing protein [Theionarchaea archaeon]
MREESCGAVIYFNSEFLLLHYESGHWGFPKGNRERGETRIETATREIEEETGLRNVEFTDFEKEIDYFYKRDEKLVYKTVTYFLARSKTKDVTISWEHTDYAWLSYEKARDQITFNNTRSVLEAAKSYLDNPRSTHQLRL